MDISSSQNRVHPAAKNGPIHPSSQEIPLRFLSVIEHLRNLPTKPKGLKKKNTPGKQVAVNFHQLYP